MLNPDLIGSSPLSYNLGNGILTTSIFVSQNAPEFLLGLIAYLPHIGLEHFEFAGVDMGSEA